MKKRNWLLPEEGSFYKANLHCHTTNSDGKWTPEQVKKADRERGYSIVAFTDHNRYAFHKDLCDEDFLALAALEVNIDRPMGETGTWNTTPVYHLNFYAQDPEHLSSVPLPDRYEYSVEAVNRYIAQMRKLGFLCCYNHPWWSLQTVEDYSRLENLDAFEIFNYGCEVEGLYGYAPQAYADLLRTGRKLACFAADDNHNAYPTEDMRSDAFGGFTMLKLPELTYEAVFDAIRKRHCYASDGPEFHSLYVEDGILHVTCSEAEKIYVHSEGRKTSFALAERGGSLKEACIPLKGTEQFIWVEMRDSKGHFAATSAYCAEELFAR